MATLELILEILIILLSLIIIVAVALQKSKSEGITGVTATSESDNYFGRNKELAGDQKLSKITKTALVVFVVISLVLTVLFSVDAAKTKQETASNAVTTETDTVVTEEEPETVNEEAPETVTDAE